MKKIDYVLEFCEELGKQMISAGANLERVQYVLERTCLAYGLNDVSLILLNTRISISAKDEEGNYAARQGNVPPQVINLERVKKLNTMSHEVSHRPIEPSELKQRLQEVTSLDFPWWVMLIGFLVAMGALARIFAGTWSELLVAELNTIGLFFLSKLYARIHLNKILTNFLGMFLSSVSALFFYQIGFIENFHTVMITNAFFLIPGIQMVNCARNLLCGHENNGVIELLKILLEVCTIVAGVAAAHAIYGHFLELATLEESMPVTSITWLSSIELVFLTLLASGGFSIVFNIHLKDLPFAALGGAVVRIFYILFQLAFSEYRFLFTLLAAFMAALYSEIVGRSRKEPATLFLYPALVPLIPGDLFYYTSLGIVWGNWEMVATYGPTLALSLLAISVGFVVCSSVLHYVRKIRLVKKKSAISQ